MLTIVLLLQAAATPLACPLDRPYDRDNAFARILRKDAPAAVVAETSDMIAFIPLGWTNPGHVLVVPRRAVRNLDDMTAKEMADALLLARRIAAAQRRALGATGYSVVQNNARSQDVCHAHFHVVPNTPAAPVKVATIEEREAIAARLREAMK